MKQWKTALIAASPAFLLLLLLLVILAMVFCHSRKLFLHGRGNNDMGNRGGYRNHGNGGVNCINVGMKKKKKKKKIKKPFVWSENPTLIVEAVERGWFAFAFTYHNPSSSSSPSIIWPLSQSTSRGSLRHQQYKDKTKEEEEEEDGSEPEISWEVVCGEGGVSSSSVQYMQRLWLNPCVAQVATAASGRLLLQVLQASLPLPGPPSLGSASASASFPQQAYFEVTIIVAPPRNRELPPPHEPHEPHEPQPQALHQTPEQPVPPLSQQWILLLNHHHHDVVSTRLIESGSAKLNEMHERSRESRTSQDMGGGVMQILPNNNNNNNINAVTTINNHSSSRKFPVKDAISHVDGPTQILAIGLAPVGFPPSRLPGSDPGSVGIHSNGFVYLSGAPKLPAIKPLWNVVNTTIGCGFDPTSKNVIFTLNGELVHEFNALGTEFGHPLFPTVAANYDVTLLVNFGQCSFAYAHANSHRIPDPGFRQRSAKNVFMIEDSGDLFSMGRIDSRWFEVRFPSMGGGSRPLDAESDLFEIVLDNSRRR